MALRPKVVERLAPECRSSDTVRAKTPLSLDSFGLRTAIVCRSNVRTPHQSRNRFASPRVSGNDTTRLRHLPLDGRGTVLCAVGPASPMHPFRPNRCSHRKPDEPERTDALGNTREPASHETASATRLSKTSARIAFRWVVPTRAGTSAAGSCADTHFRRLRVLSFGY